MGVPSRAPSSYGASDLRDVHCGGREAFSRLARRREVSHLARLGLVLRIRAAFADCVLPSGALLLIECLVLRGLEEGRPALLRTAGYQPRRSEAGRATLYVCVCQRGADTSSAAPLAWLPHFLLAGAARSLPHHSAESAATSLHPRSPGVRARRPPRPQSWPCSMATWHQPSGDDVAYKAAIC
jgi:hypothetical protein